MNEQLTDPNAAFRRAAYIALIVVSAGMMTGRILSVKSTFVVKGRGGTARTMSTPLLSANDRSRWCTVRALVDHGTYAIDDVLAIEKEKAEKAGEPARYKAWDTIDKIQHKGPDDNWHYYSSKPPLLPTLVAGQYWAIQQLSGATLEEQPFYVVRIILIITNVLPLMIAFILLSRIVDRLAATDFARIFIMAAATFGTFLTTFAVTLNNHVVAAASATIAVYAAVCIGYDKGRHSMYFVLAGLCGAFAAANELPALALLALLAAALLFKAPIRTLLVFVPSAAIVVVAFFLTNYIAHQDLRPAYHHMGKDGPVLTTTGADLSKELNAGAFPEVFRIELIERLGLEQGESDEDDANILTDVTVTAEPDAVWLVHDNVHDKDIKLLASGEDIDVYWADDEPVLVSVAADVLGMLKAGKLPEAIRSELNHVGLGLSKQNEDGFQVSSDVTVTERQSGDRWVLFDNVHKEKYAAVLADGKINVHQWYDWYDFEGAYWSGDIQSKEEVEPSRLVYLSHMLVGHHGIFSLTPIWILAAIGCVVLAVGRNSNMRALAVITGVLTVVVVGFYVKLPMEQRNYGGQTCCLRWLIWFTPLWLLTMIPVVDWLGKSRFGRLAVLLLLLVSAVSAGYAASNPWTDPWIDQYLQYLVHA